MAWTEALTWTPKLVTAANLNQQIRDNLDFLKDPPSEEVLINEASDYTTSSTSFVDVDATDLSLDLTTNGGDVLIVFQAPVAHSSNAGRIYFDVTEDGSRIGGDDGLTMTHIYGAARVRTVSFYLLHTPPAPGTYTYRIQWKTSGATATLYAGAGTANYDAHPYFFVREIS